MIIAQPVAQSPDDVMALPQRKAMLEIPVKGVEFFPKEVGNLAVGMIVVKLELQVGSLRKSFRPAAYHVAAVHIYVARVQLVDGAIVGVSLNCKGVVALSGPISPEAALGHLP